MSEPENVILNPARAVATAQIDLKPYRNRLERARKLSVLL